MGQRKSKQMANQTILSAMSVPKEPLTNILLLGSSSTGKSALFKCIRSFTNEEYPENNELNECTHVVRQNCVAGILTLLKKSQELHDEDPVKYSSCLVNMNDDTISDIQTIVDFSSETFGDIEWDNESYAMKPRILDYVAMKTLGESIGHIWNLDAIKAVYSCTDKYSFPDNMDFFFNKVRQIMNETYVPTKDDYLKARVRTTGMVEYKYEIRNNNVRIMDVGSTRNERKKWTHSYQNYSTGLPMDCVMYVCALNFYCKVLFEDEKHNALQENINLFESICNGTHYRTVSATTALQSSHLILVLTKPDLFKQSLKAASLSVCFDDEYKGRNYNGLFDGIMYTSSKYNYNYSMDFNKINKLMAIIFGDDNMLKIPIDITNIVCHFVDLSELSLKAAYDDGVEFIVNKLLSKNKVNRNINVFVVNATVPEKVSDMMNSIYDILIPSVVK